MYDRPERPDRAIRPERVNINTFLLAGLVGICGWTLLSVSNVSGDMKASNVRHDQHDKDIVDLRTRLASVETDLLKLRIQVAKNP